MAEPGDFVALLGEVQAARDLLRDRPEPARPSAAELWRHVRRRPGDPVSFAIERAVRSEPDVGRRYRTMLAAGALAHAPMALAASDGPIASRRVGAYELTIETDGEPPLLVIACGEAPAPALIEVSLGDEIARLDLPEPVAGAIVIAIDKATPVAVLIGRLLADRRSAVFLV